MGKPGWESQDTQKEAKEASEEARTPIFWIWRAKTHLWVLGHAVEPSAAKPGVSQIIPGNRQI